MAQEAEVEIVAKDSATQGNQNDESATEDAPDFEESTTGEPESAESLEKGKSETPAGEGVKEVTAKVVYTPQELEALLQSEGEIDTSRLSTEGKALMKSFQRGMEKKFQQVAEMRKAAEAQAKPQDPREQLFQRYVQDPGGVTDEINSEIEKLESVDPADAQYAAARKTIARLHALKDGFFTKRQSVIEHGQQADIIVANTQAEITKAIPDFETKAPKLTEFAVSLGLTLKEVQALTDPMVVGPMALRLTKAINAAYDKINAPRTAETKVKKDAPPPLQRGGSGKTLEKKVDDDDPGQKPMGEYLTWRKKHIAD